MPSWRTSVFMGRVLAVFVLILAPRACGEDEPVLVLASISSGDGHTCGVAPNSTAHCWGYNRWGQVGSASVDPDRAAPDGVPGDLAFALVDAGGLHSCGISTAGSAVCWGHNDWGQLGDATLIDHAARGMKPAKS